MQPRIRVMFTLFHHFGVGLIEFTATLAVISILLYLATPTFSNLMTQYRLKAATETLYANLQLAKLSAIRKNKSLRIYFKSMNGGASWCYGLNENGSCDCSTANSCQVDNVSNTVSSYDYPDVSIETHISSPGDHFTFESTRGIMDGTFGHVRFISGEKQSRVIVNRLGRIRYCSPDGSAHVAGYSTSC